MQTTGEPSPQPWLSKLAELPKKQPLTAQRVTSSSLFPYKFYSTVHLYWKQLPSFLQQHIALPHQDSLCWQWQVPATFEAMFSFVWFFFSFFPQTEVFTKAPLNRASFSNYVVLSCWQLYKVLRALSPSLGWRVPALYFVSTTMLCLPSFSTLPISSVDSCVPDCCPLCQSVPHSLFFFLLLFLPLKCGLFRDQCHICI